MEMFAVYVTYFDRIYDAFLINNLYAYAQQCVYLFSFYLLISITLVYRILGT